VLPHSVSREPPVRFNYRASGINLANDAVDHWRACRFKPKDAAAEAEDLTWGKLLAAADTIERCSLVDGCVVLSRGLNLLGFGGEITSRDEDAERSQRPLRNLLTGELTFEQALKNAGSGTRHRSALRLCMCLAGAFAAVISQDGDLKVFWSDEKNVYGFERLYVPNHL
jgi:hypothetical protein